VPVSCFIPFKLSVACDNQTKVLDVAEGYCKVIMSNIHVDRTDRTEVEWNLLGETAELQAGVDDISP
jgi:hypothetical protein